MPLYSRFQGNKNDLLKSERQVTAIYHSNLNQKEYIKELEKEISIYPIIQE